MSFTFKPLSEDEIDSMNLMDEGIYNFEVRRSTRKTSKANNPMSELILKVWDAQGKEHSLYDYLVFSNVNLNIRKVKHFCDATGLQAEYKTGNIREELGGLTGKVHIGRQTSMPKDTGGFYPAKNVVLDYVVCDVSASAPIHANTGTPFIDSDIPF